jgi:hypothetical protein
VLSLVSVAVATLPTLAGLFPLWLAVTLHEGSTLLVALNSLRLLVDSPPPPPPKPKPARQAPAAAAAAAPAAAPAAAEEGGPPPAGVAGIRKEASLDSSEPEGWDASSSSSTSSTSSNGGGARSASDAGGSDAGGTEDGAGDGAGEGAGAAAKVAARGGVVGHALPGKQGPAAPLQAAAALHGIVAQRHKDRWACAPISAAPAGRKGAHCSHCRATM